MIQVIAIVVSLSGIAVVGGAPSLVALVVLAIPLCVFILWPRKLVGVPSPAQQTLPASLQSPAHSVTAEPIVVVSPDNRGNALTHTETYELTIEQGRTHLWVRRRTEIPNASPQLARRLLEQSYRPELPPA